MDVYIYLYIYMYIYSYVYVCSVKKLNNCPTFFKYLYRISPVVPCKGGMLIQKLWCYLKVLVGYLEVISWYLVLFKSFLLHF